MSKYCFLIGRNSNLDWFLQLKWQKMTTFKLSYSLFFAQAEKVGLNWNYFLVTKTDFQTTGQKYTNFWNELSETYGQMLTNGSTYTGLLKSRLIRPKKLLKHFIEAKNEGEKLQLPSMLNQAEVIQSLISVRILVTVFPHIVSAETILFLICKSKGHST